MQLALSSGAGPLTTLPPTTSTHKPNKTTQRSVPAFLNKLFTMVSDPTTNDLIRWSDDGDSFFVPSADKFGKELLPRFFKHSNFGSFVRQLNMYGFHKVPHLQQGVLKADGEDRIDMLEFSNPNFTRDQPDLLMFIRRQKAKGDSNTPGGGGGGDGDGNEGALSGPGVSGSKGGTSHSKTSTALDLPTLLTDLSAIRKHQTAISADLKDLQHSNQLLWQEALASREKHRKQEETINKILRFLAGVFGGQVLDGRDSNGGGVAGGVTGQSSSVDSPGADSATGSEAGEGSSRKDGKGKGREGGNGGVVVMPKGRGRLLLEDVKGRQQERAAALRELDGSEEEEIEEIPLLQDEEDELPTISSSMITSSAPAQHPSLVRSNSQALVSPNRFTSLPPASPSPVNPFSNLDFSSFSPDTMQQFLSAAGSNPNQFSSLFNTNNNGGIGNSPQPQPSGSIAPMASTSSALTHSHSGYSLPVPTSSSASSFNHSGAMIPSPPAAFAPMTTSNPFDFGMPLSAPSSSSSSNSALQTHAPYPSSTAPTLSPSLVSNINEHDAILRSVISEKHDIDRRTTELEDQITRLMKNLPEETRDQVMEMDGPGSTSALGSASLENGGFDWGSATGDNGELDLDKLLEQFTNAPTPQAQASYALNNSLPSTTSTATDYDPLSSMDYSSLFNPNDSLPSTTPSNYDPIASKSINPFPTNIEQPQSTIPPTFPYEVTSPAQSSLANSPASTSAGYESVSTPKQTVEGETATSNIVGSGGGKKSTTGGGGGGKKRKSDVLGELETVKPSESGGSPAAGTRKSTRTRK